MVRWIFSWRDRYLTQILLDKQRRHSFMCTQWGQRGCVISSSMACVPGACRVVCEVCIGAAEKGVQHQGEVTKSTSRLHSMLSSIAVPSTMTSVKESLSVRLSSALLMLGQLIAISLCRNCWQALQLANCHHSLVLHADEVQTHWHFWSPRHGFLCTSFQVRQIFSRIKMHVLLVLTLPPYISWSDISASASEGYNIEEVHRIVRWHACEWQALWVCLLHMILRAARLQVCVWVYNAHVVASLDA